MARIRVNRNSFVSGVLSKKAQANSNAELYNFGMDLCRNMIIDPLGGAYSRQGSTFVCTLPSDRCRLIEFLYAPGKSCMVLFSEEGINFYKYSKSGITTVTTKFDEQNKLKYEDFSKMPYFQLENKLYFYINRREGGVHQNGFWSIELEAESEFLFVIKRGYKFTPGPKTPYSPTRLLKVHRINNNYSFKAEDEDGAEDPTIFSEADIGRKISFKFSKVLAGDRTGVFWPEVEIKEVVNGEITKAVLTAGSTNEAPPTDLPSVREWFISAFDGNSVSGGRLGNPEALTLFQGRLYIGKNTYVCVSKLNQSPLCFAMGPDGEDGFVHRITSGNMGNILWMYPIEKLIIGTADGVYLIGNTAQYAEPITALTFVANKIGSMGCGSLRPIDAEGNIIFVGTDNRLSMN